MSSVHELPKAFHKANGAAAELQAASSPGSEANPVKRLVGRLLNSVVLFEVVFPAQQLDVVCRAGRATFGPRNNVIKVQVISRTAHRAPASVPLPDLQFYRRGYDPPRFRLFGHGHREVFLAFNSSELELEDASAIALLSP